MIKEKANRVMDKARDLSTGLAVTVAFLNVALLVVKIAKEVTKN